jgi:hypothetical protein
VLEIPRLAAGARYTDCALWAVPPGGGAPERVELPAETLTAPGGIAVGRHAPFASYHATEPTRVRS